jgi:hypothetical protein
MTVPNVAACYFCLGEEADEEGNLPVRDCSCRGDSAGFAHLSCLAQYAEQKSKQASDGEMAAFSNPWRYCNNCKQPFENQLSVDLASAFVEFAQATYGHEGNNKWDKLRVMESLRLKIVALTKCKSFKERMKTINNLLSTIDQTKKDYKMSRWIHMPKDSEEYQYYRLLCGNYEAFAYDYLGIAAYTNEGAEIAIAHFKKARAIYNLVDMVDGVQYMENKIATTTVNIEAVVNDQNRKSVLEIATNNYENELKRFAMNSTDAILSGLNYARALRIDNHCIESERLVTKLAAISRRVHGPEHKTTMKADEVLKEFKKRYVIVLPDIVLPEIKQFQALRYENEGEICVVQGPVTTPRMIEDERVYNVEWNLVIPNIGCVVICHGLVSAPHLNGEVGDVRNTKVNINGLRVGVFFEKKSLMSALVKPENLRILFKLSCEEK